MRTVRPGSWGFEGLSNAGALNGSRWSRRTSTAIEANNGDSCQVVGRPMVIMKDVLLQGTDLGEAMDRDGSVSGLFCPVDYE